MNDLLKQIRDCRICEEHLPLGPRPVVSGNKKSKIIIIGQAPGTKVHESGVPWKDASGNQLRKWLDVSDEEFYNEDLFALVPMGFCYPGKGSSGDLPPRKECAEAWHQKLLSNMPDIELTLLIGGYSQNYYLGDSAERTLTETVKAFRNFLPNRFPLPHPSPRNRFWLSKNPWFEMDVLPVLREKVSLIIRN